MKRTFFIKIKIHNTRDKAWGAVMRPVPLPDINEMNKKTIMTTMNNRK